VKAAARFILGVFAACRGGVLLLMAVVAWCLPRFDEGGHTAMPLHPVWSRFFYWDSFHYGRIVADGYQTTEPTAAFFPAYPYLARWLGYALGSSWAAGLVVSYASTLAGAFFLYGLARGYGGDAVARRAVFFALVFPSSLFFSCFYAEGLYFAAVAGALYFYEESSPAGAGICGFVAALTRPTGILLFPALAIGVLHRARWRLREVPLRSLWILAIPAGLGVVMAVLQAQVGDPLAFVHAQAAWARKSTFPLLSIAQASQDVVASGFAPWSGTVAQSIAASQSLLRIVDMAAVMFLFACAAFSLRRLDAAHTVFILLSVIAPLSSGLVLSIERFASGVVPVYLVLAMAAGTERRTVALAAASAALLAMHVVFFGMGLPAG
jgi:hypothetical protein